MRIDASIDHYRTLGVAPDAEADVIRAAYLALVRKHHPDAAGADGREAAERRTKDINAAFSVIGDPERRKAYDEARRRNATQRPASGHAPGRGGPRSGGPKGRGPVAGGQAAFRTANPQWRPSVPGSRRKGPSLQARQKRLEQVRRLSLGLGLVALVALLGGAAVAIATLKPGLLRSAAGSFSPPVSEAQVEAATSPELLDEVMLPWPDVHPGQTRVFAAEGGLTVTFEGRRGEESVAMTIRSADGKTHRLTGNPRPSAERTSFFGLGKLNRADAHPTVLVASWSNADCCMDVTAVRREGDAWRALELGSWPSAVASDFPRDIDGDGRREWVLTDERFSAAFGPSTPAPPRIVQMREGRLTDVSASGRYGEVFSNHLGGAQRLCSLGSEGACAAFVADAARLGRVEWAWNIMLRNYQKDAAGTSTGCTEPGQTADCDNAGGMAFPVVLERFLKREGYIEPALALPAAEGL